jgi:NTE family protein
MGLDPDEAMERVEAVFVRGKALRRLTIPLHSLFDHRAFDAQLREHLGATAIEDMPLNYFAVSTDLATNAMRVHRRGPLWEAVRGSGAIPGLLPPLVTPDGGVLVDGALVDNVPVRVMRGLKAGPNVVVAVAEDDSGRIEADYGALPSRLGLARDLVLRRRRPFPGIVNVLTRSMLVASRQMLRSTSFEDDALFVVSPLPGMGVLDWRRGREQAALAYDHVRRRIEEVGGLDRLFRGTDGDAAGDGGSGATAPAG